MSNKTKRARGLTRTEIRGLKEGRVLILRTGRDSHYFVSKVECNVNPVRNGDHVSVKVIEILEQGEPNETKVGDTVVVFADDLETVSVL